MILNRRQTLIMAASATAASAAGFAPAWADDPQVTIDPAKLMAHRSGRSFPTTCSATARPPRSP